MSCWPGEEVASLSDVTSNRTFNPLFLTLPNPGVPFHAPGGAGVCNGKVFPLWIGSGVDTMSLVFDGRVFDRARPERKVGAGVCIQPPGGLGVFIIVKLLDMTGVDCSDPSEDGKSGRSGMSGMFVGNKGVLSVIFDVLDVSRGGVTSERAGSMMIGGESATGEPFFGEPLGGDPPLVNGNEASCNGDSSLKPETRGEGSRGNGPGRGVLLMGESVGDSSSLSR